ncbi:hypothetical protein ABIE26_003965 [Pedobacter africanus]|uniref:Uncharacterized protein n=1 Tax=Pedobacter africanus TaxID=151894 RepID=A0ACC6L1Q6_9SPHI|nr:HAD domain-containing protein [Pedobacter africanus]MDR6785266.1 hypothetical protein [Pedobacter africanus]
MLILLDIDGVMVPANSWRRPEFREDGFPAFTSKSVEALNRIISETNADLILTTSHKSKYSLPQWKNIFKNRGIEVKSIKRLTANDANQDRKGEILRWFKKRKSNDGDFVIIDDDKMLNGLPVTLKENLVLTSPSVGLTDELADTAIAKLKHQDPNFNLSSGSE